MPRALAAKNKARRWLAHYRRAKTALPYLHFTAGEVCYGIAILQNPAALVKGRLPARNRRFLPPPQRAPAGLPGYAAALTPTRRQWDTLPPPG